MAIGDERVVIDVKDTEHGTIVYTDKAGKQTTYYPSKPLWLNVQSLQIGTSLRASRDGTDARVERYVSGMAELEDRSIAVVGDPASAARRLKVSFSTGHWDRPPEMPEDDERFRYVSKLGYATLGFNRANWEFGTSDEWFAQCHVPQSFVEALEADVRSGQMSSMQLSLGLRGLYMDDHPFTPIAESANLFIRPSRHDNTLACPDMAEGYVSSVHFVSAPRDLRGPAPTEPSESQEPIYTEPPPPTLPEPVAEAVAGLSTRLDQLRGTLKWVGGFIVLGLLILAGK